MTDPAVLAMLREVELLVGIDGTDNLGVIVRQALADDPSATARDIAEIVIAAREEWREESRR